MVSNQSSNPISSVVERPTFNRVVVGSIPTSGANFLIAILSFTSFLIHTRNGVLEYDVNL